MKEIKCGYNYPFALMKDESVYSWGSNYFGELGIGNDEDQYPPYLTQFLYCPDTEIDYHTILDECLFPLLFEEIIS